MKSRGVEQAGERVKWQIIWLHMIVVCGGSLSWAVGQFGRAEAEQQKQGGENPYELVCREAAASPVGAKGLLFLPHLIGERSPQWNDRARGAFAGLTLEHTRGDLLRAVTAGIGAGVFRDFQAAGHFVQAEERYLPRREAQIVYDQLKPLYDEAYHGLESVFQKLYQLSNGRRPDSAAPAPDILRGQDSV